MTKLIYFVDKSKNQARVRYTIKYMALEVVKRSLSIKDADATNKRSRSARSVRTKKASKKATSAKSTPATTSTKSASPKKSTPSKTKTRSKQTATSTKKPAKKKAGAMTTKPVTIDKTTTRKTSAKKAATKANKRNKNATSKAAKKRTTTSAINSRQLAIAKPKRKDDSAVPITKRDPLGHLLLEQLLRNEGFTGVVTTDKHILEEYSTDESIFSITPQLVIRPYSVGDIEIATRIVARETSRFASLSLTPRAAGTGLSGGSLTDSVVLDMTGSFDEIGDIKYRPKHNDATITAGVGVLWRDLSDALSRVGMHIPTYSTAHEICTVGGAVANNTAGTMSAHYGRCADFIESLDVVLFDGNHYEIKPLNYKEFKKLSKKNNALAKIATETILLLEQEAKVIKNSIPAIVHNTAGFNVWDTLPQGVAAFKKGNGFFDLTKLFAGSQGTIGVVTSVTFRAIPLPETPTTIVVPIFNVADLPHVLDEVKTYNPLQIEAFDGATYDLALKNPEHFRKFVRGLSYYRTLLALYTTHHARYSRNIPEFTLLISLDSETTAKTPASIIAKRISTSTSSARVLYNPFEEQALWMIRRASYDLSRMQDEIKRPAAFVEDMMVPLKSLPKYITGIKKLCREFNIKATMYGHIGTGHLHLFPLLDFTNKTTPALIEKMSEQFYSLATKHGGTISAEHNDGIIRTPHLDKLYSKQMVSVFERLEAIFDPDDIFNPGKKVNPRFAVRDVLRTTNY